LEVLTGLLIYKRKRNDKRVEGIYEPYQLPY